MNKSSLITFFLVIVLFVGAVNYSSTLQKPFLSSFNFIKETYHNVVEGVQGSLERHFHQAKTIDALKEELQKCQMRQLVMEQMQHKLEALYKANDANLSKAPDIELVRATAYEKLGNFNRLWLDVAEYNSSKIYGLTYKNMVAGIVINKDQKPLALLNNDIKSTYAVSIGKTKAPGIAHGNEEENIVVNYIPAWYALHVGDEVRTSGLDNIFFRGLKVGVVVEVSRAEGYQNAVVKPYYKANEADYFYLIRGMK